MTFLTPEECASRPVVPATEQMPDIGRGPRGEGLVIESGGEAVPEIEIHLEKLAGVRRGTQWRVDIRFDEERVHRLPARAKSQGHIAVAELEKLARMKTADPRAAFRPNWLNLRYHPQLLPKISQIAALRRPHTPRLPPGTVSLFRSELDVINDWPWCTIGKLFVGQGGNFDNPTSFASGVLVGPNLMMTASHAVPWGVDQWWMRFVPAYRDGAGPFGSSMCHDSTASARPTTTAITSSANYTSRSARPAGWMGSWASTDDDFYEDRGWDSVGYPTDFMSGQRPAAEWNITPEDADVSATARLRSPSPRPSPAAAGVVGRCSGG